MSCRHVLAENAETTSFTQKRICHWYIMLGVMPLETPIIWRNSIRSFQAGTSILNAEQFDRLKSLQKCLLAMHTLSAVDVPCASLALNVSLPHSLVLRQGGLPAQFNLLATCCPLYSFTRGCPAVAGHRWHPPVDRFFNSNLRIQTDRMRRKENSKIPTEA